MKKVIVILLVLFLSVPNVCHAQWEEMPAQEERTYVPRWYHLFGPLVLIGGGVYVITSGYEAIGIGMVLFGVSWFSITLNELKEAQLNDRVYYLVIGTRF